MKKFEITDIITTSLKFRLMQKFLKSCKYYSFEKNSPSLRLHLRLNVFETHYTFRYVICKEIATGFIRHLAVEEITSSGIFVQIPKKIQQEFQDIFQEVLGIFYNLEDWKDLVGISRDILEGRDLGKYKYLQGYPGICGDLQGYPGSAGICKDLQGWLRISRDIQGICLMRVWLNLFLSLFKY